MKLGVLTAILGEHHLAFRDNLCTVPHEEPEREDHEGRGEGEALKASNPAGWPE